MYSVQVIMDNNKIRENVKKLINDAKSPTFTVMRNTDFSKYELELKKKHSEFQAVYPALFKKCIENPTGFEYKKLEEMLSYKMSVEREKISYDKASEELGIKYFNEYMKPKLSKEQRKLYEDGLKQVKKEK